MRDFLTPVLALVEGEAISLEFAGVPYGEALDCVLDAPVRGILGAGEAEILRRAALERQRALRGGQAGGLSFSAALRVAREALQPVPAVTPLHAQAADLLEPDVVARDGSVVGRPIDLALERLRKGGV